MYRPYKALGVFLIIIAFVLLISFLNSNNSIKNIPKICIAPILFFIGLWLYFKKVYTCKKATEDIDFYFSDPKEKKSEEKQEAFWRVLRHMTKGTTPEEHIIFCTKCWDYYTQMKQKHCGG